jgi:glycosyltransferase involved in cell wall biosynthesis
MHICFITSEYPKTGFPHGGVGTFIKTLAEKLAKNNIRVSIVGINYENKNEFLVENGVNVYRLIPSKLKGFIWYFNSQTINSTIKRIHQLNKIDIVEATELQLAFIKKNKEIKYLIRMNGGHHFFAESENRGLNCWKAFQEKKSFKKADYVLGVSEYVVNHTSKYINFESKKKGVIFNPANLERFYEANINKVVKGRIFFAGTICEKKGIRQLVQAIPLIKKEIPNAHLVIAGREWFFPKTKNSYTEYLKSFIDESIKDDIQFLGNIENTQIPIEIEKANVCCYPSHMEAMPLAWIEVMSMGKPFVASHLGPGPEVIQHYENGLLCNPLDPVDIANKIVKLLKNKELSLKLAKNARQSVLDKFDSEKIFKQNITLYQSLK